MKKTLIAVICTSSALAFLLGACGADNSDTNCDSSSQTFSPSEGDGATDSQSDDDGAGESSSDEGSTFENGVLTTPDMKIEITRHKVIQVGKKGNEYGEKPVIAFWYDTTNLSGEEVDPSTAFILTFNAFQDNNPNAMNELNVASLPDDKFLDSQTEDIKKGGTVENAIAYELDDLVTPVDLVANEGLDDVIGKATFELN